MEPSSPADETTNIRQSVLTTVTPFSKYLAMILFVAMPFIGGWVGYMYVHKEILVVEKIVVKEAEIDPEVSDERSSDEVTNVFEDDYKKYLIYLLQKLGEGEASIISEPIPYSFEWRNDYDSNISKAVSDVKGYSIHITFSDPDAYSQFLHQKLHEDFEYIHFFEISQANTADGPGSQVGYESRHDSTVCLIETKYDVLGIMISCGALDEAKLLDS